MASACTVKCEQPARTTKHVGETHIVDVSDSQKIRPPPSLHEEHASMRHRLIALAALGSINTASGFLTKHSQVGGNYSYNPASAIVCAETFKLLISMGIIAKMILRREVGGNEQEQQPVGIAEASALNYKPLTIPEFADRASRFLRQEFSVPLLVHTGGLALVYAVVNLIFYTILVYTSGSIFYLLKSSSPVVTALLLYALVNRTISKPQWFAVAGQCVGLLATQVNPCSLLSGASGIELPLTGYLLILLNVGVSCGAGVWNEHVVKTYGASLNVQNVVLYSWGVLVNYALFLWAPPSWMGVSPDLPALAFFEGYSLSVVCLICANGSVGLVIGAVYKYADVVVKTFGLAASTVTLFLLELVGLLPTHDLGVPMFSTVLGAAVVFYAAYLYILPIDAFKTSTGPGGSTASHRIPPTWSLAVKTQQVRGLLYLVVVTAMVSSVYLHTACPPFIHS